MRILVTGSREWRRPGVIGEAILAAAGEFAVPLSEVVVVHGDCPRGADRMARNFVEFHPDLHQERHPARWREYGRRAGFVRNEWMIRKGARVCLAFIRNGSSGTSMCSRLAEDAGIPLRRYVDNDSPHETPWQHDGVLIF